MTNGRRYLGETYLAGSVLPSSHITWDTAARAAALSRTTLLGRLGEPALVVLAEAARVRSFPPGADLVREGEPGGSVLVLVEGAATVYRAAASRRAALAHLRPPAVIGEVTVLDRSPRTATVEAVSASVALELQRADLLRCAAAGPGFLDGLLAALGEGVRRASASAADAVALDLTGRVAKTLVVLAGDGSAPDVVRLSQARIAELAGGSRQSLNQVLGMFAVRGLLHVQGREIVLDDVEALRRRAGMPELPRKGR